MNIPLRDVEMFFFQAMMQGYADNETKRKTVDMLHHKEVDIIQGDWRCLDRYCVTPLSDKSAGSTTIWYQGIPVWVMNYGGDYKEEAIDFLKLALRSNYEEMIFLGCRGPAIFTHLDNPLIYTNSMSKDSHGFGDFKGCETIKNKSTYTMLGYHEYWGMSLLP